MLVVLELSDEVVDVVDVVVEFMGEHVLCRVGIIGRGCFSIGVVITIIVITTIVIITTTIVVI